MLHLLFIWNTFIKREEDEIILPSTIDIDAGTSTIKTFIFLGILCRIGVSL